MKGIIRTFIFYLVSFWFITLSIHSIVFDSTIQNFALIAAVFTVAQYLVKPVVSLLLLPISLFSGGIFSLATNFVAFVATITIFPQIRLETWVFPGMTISNIALPTLTLTPLITLILVSLFLTFAHRIFNLLIN